ncbi:MAG TPA: hypothetical protein P5092_13950 [Ruminococcus sp.]|nr:hypothetical protein [Ruminococcus sp.]
MKVAPLIHSRTFQNDFLSGFLVRPEYFTSNDIDWARQLIRASTADIDLMQGERYVVLDNGNIRIAGIVIVTEQLAQKANSELHHKYFFDDKGRNVYAFIGFCMKLSEIEKPINADYSDFMAIFERYVVPIWEEKVIETRLEKEEIILNDEKQSDNGKISEGFRLHNSVIYESNPDLDAKWFRYYLNSKKSNFTFCTNITKYATLKNSVFSVLTTNPNNIKRLQMDMPSIKQSEKDNEEKAYLEFKEKYKERLIKEFYPGIKQSVISDRSIIDQIISDNSEMILQAIFEGKLTETEHFRIVELGYRLHKAAGYGDEQKPISIVKK